MSKPDLFPKTSTSGIALDPRTLERVVPESRRPDGTVRKQLKIRPGFTPQEDVNRFRGSRQAQMDANKLPKGHIIGWAPPTSNTSASAPKSKAAKKNEKRKEKRKEKATVEKVKDNWEDDDEDEEAEQKPDGIPATRQSDTSASEKKVEDKDHSTDSSVIEITEKLKKTDVNP